MAEVKELPDFPVNGHCQVPGFPGTLLQFYPKDRQLQL